MGRETAVVRVSSKGQIVIPIAFRRKLGLTTGQALAVRSGTEAEIVLRPVERESDAADEMRRRLRAAARKVGGDPLRELHERRRRERELESRQHDRWRH